MKTKALAAAVAATAAAVVATAAGVVAGTSPRPQQAMREVAADVAPCAASQLSLGPLRTGAASGEVLYTVAVVNRSTTTCSLAGFPRLSLLGAGGVALAAPVRQGVAALSQSQAVRPVVLAPRGTASVTVGFAEDPSDAAACPPARGLALGLPGAAGSLSLGVPLGPCHGSLQTTPFVAGDSQPR